MPPSHMWFCPCASNESHTVHACYGFVHCTALHSLHCATLYSLHYSHCTSLTADCSPNCSALQCIPLHCTAPPSLHSTALCRINFLLSPSGAGAGTLLDPLWYAQLGKPTLFSSTSVGCNLYAELGNPTLLRSTLCEAHSVRHCWAQRRSTLVCDALVPPVSTLCCKLVFQTSSHHVSLHLRDADTEL